MKKTTNVLGYIVTTHNEREEKLLRIVLSGCKRVREWYNKSCGMDRYYDMAKSEAVHVDEMLTAFYFMDCVNKTPSVDMWDILDNFQ